MKKKEIILILTIIATLMFLSLISSVSAASSNLGNIDVESNSAIVVNNDNAPEFIKAPDNYAQSEKYSKTKGFEKTKNIINTKKGKNYKFITKYFLPVSWKNGGKNGKTEYWYNCQSIVIKGKYMYILTSAGYDSNKGFIIQYNTQILDKYLKGKKLTNLRILGYQMREGKNLTGEGKRLKKAIKTGPIFNTGHGQSLSYNHETKSLWMWRDDNYNSNIQKLIEINMKTFKPKKMYKFRVKYKNNLLKAFHNLAFDKNGNFYTDKTMKSKSNPNGASYIFIGKIINNKVQMKLLTIIKKRPGTYSQSISINFKNNRFYLVSDGVFYSMPLHKLVAGTLSKNDFYYTIFSTKREFEGLSFDSKGRAYLLVLRGTEILISNNI
ncbi:hypothetical protein ALNOE001_15190 [Candidatus Methanobinarius endosymbioticus]|uniref:Uncharacterized protein n=1 Tax=Candidatus Methanobinarius endosymbioticus TaxID=2006182 RepID=A0A366MAT3_9EURY|nr:hypothetical protein ALNOE001_15190 [Candidatus Methanobinarius endosymbioticus]